MKKFILLFFILLAVQISLSAQPYKVDFKVSIPSDCNGGSSVLLYHESGVEGIQFLIPAMTLPAELASYQSYYDVFAGGLVGLEEGTLNENITIDVNLEYLKCSPNDPKYLELVRMSIKVIGENSGSHDVFSYYQFNPGKKAFIKLKAQKLFDYLEQNNTTIDELAAWFYGEGFTPDVTGISYMYSDTDPDWFNIYLEHFSKIVLGKITSTTDVVNNEHLPTKYGLAQNFPNPFNPSTTITYTIPSESNVQLSIYNLQGELIKTLVNQAQGAGLYSVKFDASNIASGTYFYKLSAGDFVQTKKMTLTK